MDDIFTLAEQEKAASNNRIAQVLSGELPRGVDRQTRAIIAQGLFDAKWDVKKYREDGNMTPEQILENFCWKIFGATFQEVFMAWDRYSG